jgi:uncharacterized membrane protein YqhA
LTTIWSENILAKNISGRYLNQKMGTREILEDVMKAQEHRDLKALLHTRYIVLLAVVTLYLLATALFGYATIKTILVLPNLVSQFSEGSTKSLMLFAVETADLFLVAVVLYVTAAGLFELFISRKVRTPKGGAAKWLEVETLDDLKQNLIGVVVVAMSVLFLGVLIKNDPDHNLLEVGVGVGAVIAALGWYVSQKSKAKESDAKVSESKIVPPEPPVESLIVLE